MIVEKKIFKLTKPLKLECGSSLDGVEIAYETYGTLNDKKDNAIFVFHALTGDCHACGKYHEDDKKSGWWDDMIGPQKAFDTNRYFVICSSILGGCSGSTGPMSVNPKTGKYYGLSFPIITIEDTVKAQRELIDFLQVEELIVAGGSMGGMQALLWSIEYSEMVKGAIIIASTSKLTAQGIAFNSVGRNAILSDKNFDNGNYYNNEKQPETGLAIARMIGHITYLCESSMDKKFGRNFQYRNSPNFDFGIDFAVESYLKHQGERFVDRFDANSYLYITKAVDYFDIESKYGSLEKAFENTMCKFLVISFSSDWLFPTKQSKDIVNALINVNKDVSFCEIESSFGHDAFLLEYKTQTKIIKSFLNKLENRG